MIALLQDILAFAEQFIPSPTTLIYKYRFSPADLDSGHGRTTPPSSSTAPATTTTSSASSSSIVCTTSDRPSNKDVVATIDILSYNVNNAAAHSPTRTRRILHAIFSSGADVVLLQETNPAWEEHIFGGAMKIMGTTTAVVVAASSSSTQFRYRHFHHPGNADRAAGGMAILSKYPLENVRVLDFTKVISGSVFPVLVCEVHVPIERCHLFDKSETRRSNVSPSNPNVTISISNVHLRPPVELDGSAWLKTARKTEPIRINEVKELIQRAALIKGGGRMENAQLPFHVIAGDFNEGDNAGALAYLASLGYIDALQQFVPRSRETHNWPFMRNLWTLRKRLDHLLWHGGALTTTLGEGGEVQRIVNLRCVECGVMTGYENGASDHQPVLSRFAIVNRDGRADPIHKINEEVCRK